MAAQSAKRRVESQVKSQGPPMAEPGDVLGFLSVDRFLGTLVAARSLKTALEIGLIDELADGRWSSREELGRALGLDQAAMAMLLGLLESSSVTQHEIGTVRLDPAFLRALEYRDLLEAKLDFAGATMNDFADLFTALIREPASFAGRARLFELFDYRLCFEFSDENYVRTRGWMRLTSALTRYEARACMAIHDFSRYRRMLDVGGNSGEFVLRLCRRNPSLEGTVFDLPLVCEIGMEHVLAEPENPRISFVKGDVRLDPLPGGFDLISFKSMLHDWPEEDALGFLDKAVSALAPGGSLMIFERLPIDPQATPIGFSTIPILLFFRSYRPMATYARHLESLGLKRVSQQTIDLDTPFGLLVATSDGPAST